MPWTRSRSNGSRLETGLVPRRRSRRLKKRNVTFKKQVMMSADIPYKCSAARSLFVVRSLSDLPNELSIKILEYFNAKELISLRLVNNHFKNLIDGTPSIWSRVSYQNMWPSTQKDYSLFRRGSNHGNVESLTKLGLSHLYHYNLTVGEEKNKKDVQEHSIKAANYLHNLDLNIRPNKPLTWMLIRPPWSMSKSICLKHLVHTQMLTLKETKMNGPLCYNIGRIFNLESDNNSNKEKSTENFLQSCDLRCSHAKFELLLARKNEISADAGKTLQWVRELRECAMTGNKEAIFELVGFALSNNSLFIEDVLNMNKLSKNLFSNCQCVRVDKLELYQPKINSLMRCILVDWLAEVAYMKDMSHEVLHAAVSYVDRYLMSRVVERTKLQLLGISCLLLAAKSHYDARQVHILTVRESSWLTDQTYQYEDVVKMMGEIIGAFAGDLWKPTSWNYLHTILALPMIDDTWKSCCHYVHDLTLQFTLFGSYKPSVVACSSLFLAGLILDRDNSWPSELEEVTGFHVKDIANCASLIHYKSFTCSSMKDDRGLPLESIKVRYRSQRMHCIASLPLQDENTLKSRILSTDSTLSCASQEPLQFVVLSNDVDETLNTSIKSVDYDGDSECEVDSESDFDESFCVGRSRLSSYHSVEEFSDDETTMDASSFNFRDPDNSLPPKESFTPIFNKSHNSSATKRNSFFDGVENHENKVTGFHGQYLEPLKYAGAQGSHDKDSPNKLDAACGTTKPSTSRHQSPKYQPYQPSSSRYDHVGRRTRSNCTHR